jgi:hypothetical protein
MEDHLGIVLSLALLQLTGSTWSAVAITLGLAEINRIPVSKAIATVVAGTAILVVPLLIVLLVAVAGLVLVLMANM